MSSLKPSKVLVISKTLGYRHESIETAIDTLRNHPCTKETFAFTFTEEPEDHFSGISHLITFDALLFLSTTGDILSEKHLRSLAEYVSHLEKAVVGIHAATLTNPYNWSFRAIFGTSFHYHPELQSARVHKPKLPRLKESESREHESIARFPEEITVEDEWYNFYTDPAKAERYRLLLAVDEGTYRDEGERLRLDPHPVAWCREAGGEEGEDVRCRVWYTSLGHSQEIWRNEVFVRHVFDGLSWAIRRL